MLTAALAVWLAVGLYRGSRVHVLRIAAGTASGDSYILCAALKKVVERHEPRVRVALLETGGTVENLRMLESSSADLAAAQADVAAGPSARTVAVLFDDTLQLLVHEKSTIHAFSDLRGKCIALPQSGGQFDSFLRIAGHFNLSQGDFRFTGADDPAADDAFASGQADALFRVRALGNPDIQRLVNAGGVRFVAIAQGAAMRIRHPAFVPAAIPVGAYMGNPSVPPDAVPTISIQRLLLAREGADPDAVRALTSILIERRQEIMQEIPVESPAVRLLAAQVRRPNVQADFVPGLHAGAVSYYDKDKPTFLQANADYVGLILSIVVMLGSWFWQFGQWMARQQKNAGDEYSELAVHLMEKAQTCDSTAALDDMRNELLAMLTAAVRDLDQDKVSEESFQSFRSVLQIALEVTRERRALVSAKSRANIASAR